MALFTGNINSWDDWGNIFQSISAFTPLVEFILTKENLPVVKIENLTPGTNAVFKAGDHVVKVFAPLESGIDQTADLQTEIFATGWANKLNITTPKMLSHGYIEDKYRFAYMITEFINGTGFTETVKSKTGVEKTNLGHKLRIITDKMNIPCKPFNDIDVINDKGRFSRWEDKYTERFKAERLKYIKSFDYGEKVFVHGDLCADNIIITPKNDIFIIDFADSVLAPKIYEHAHIAVALFDLDPAFLHGYFGDYHADDLAETCFNGLLIHDFGGDIVRHHIGDPDEFPGLDDLRKRFRQKIEEIFHNR